MILMRKNELNTGMKVRLRNGEVYSVVLNCGSNSDDLLIKVSNNSKVTTESIFLSSFLDGLLHKFNEQLDIMAVYGCTYYKEFFVPYVGEGDALLWEREILMKLYEAVALNKRIKTNIKLDTLTSQSNFINTQLHTFQELDIVLNTIRFLCSNGHLKLASELLNCDWIVENK